MNTQFKKGIIELCVLQLIGQKDMYSFEVIETISKDIEVNENTIYPILRRLHKQGYFETYKENGEIGAPRKFYKLTDDGKEHLFQARKEWLDFVKSVSKILSTEEEHYEV